uniref:Putative dehydratase n=1 Tax=Streptomyces versipellis TaxID=67375 RepID=A0A0B6VJI7_9ACTN|nr:putative dehydratase [Streptomyces versipellis]
MNDLGELRQYVTAHANAQRIGRATCREVLDRVHHDEDGQPGSWAVEWTAAARAQERRGRLLEACRLYNIARFPYPDGEARQLAAEQSVRVFGRWAAGQPDITYLDLDVNGRRVTCWATGLSEPEPRPLLLVMGGIVSTKEQWAGILGQVRALGLAAVVAELPGVGENTLPYDEDGPGLISALLDRIGERADVSRTYALAMSFSGHLALRCALRDRRIKGVVTGGAPVHDFFTDTDWWSRLPRITVDSLAHLTRTPPRDLNHRLRHWAIGPEELAALDIPVHYVASLRDEIIPPGEVRLLRGHARRLNLLEVDDVHGSPAHTTLTRLWCALAVQRLRGGAGARTAVLRTLVRLAGARHGVRVP